MKRFLFVLLTCYSLSSVGQVTMSQYLEGDPANFQELLQWAMDPRFSEEMKTKPEVIEEFVFKAGLYEYYSAEDIDKWRACMKYLIDLGVRLNDDGEDEYMTLFYLTSPVNLGVDASSNRYQLHTVLLELGGRTENVLDGYSYLYSELVYSDSANLVRQAYIADFVNWTEDRKRAWLFGVVGSMDEMYEDYDLSRAIRSLVIANGFNVNLRTKNEKASLFDVAVRTGKFQTATVLLENGFTINQRCFACNGETPLHNVVFNKEFYQEEGSFDLILKMLALGADPDLRDLKGLTPVHYAIRLKNETAFRAFMEPEVTFNYQTGTLKGVNYYDFFVKEWGDQDFLQMLSDKTGLKAALTKKEIKEQKAKAKKGKDKKSQEPASVEETAEEPAEEGGDEDGGRK